MGLANSDRRFMKGYAVLATDASNLAVAAILTQPGDVAATRAGSTRRRMRAAS